MSRFKKASFWIGVPVLLAMLAGLIGNHYFKPELKAMFWHERHGDFLEVGAVRLRIPAGYSASTGRNGLDATLTAEPGLFQQSMYAQEKVRLGKMDFWFQDEMMRRIGSERMRGLMSMRFTSKQFHHVDRAYSLGGQDGICSEYSITYGGEIYYGTRFSVVCTFGADSYAQFEGTPPSAADFYQIIKSAQLQRKN